MTVSAPSHAELLALWEQARKQSLAQRAIALLGAACPRSPVDELLALPVGERDSRLLRLREAIFGPAMQSVATCPGCETRLEFTLQAGVLASAAQPVLPRRISVDGAELTVRAVSGGDLIAAARCTSVTEARRLICRRCLLDAVADEELSDAAVEQVSAALAEVDPGAELILDVSCDCCTHRWPVVVDVVSFLWTEVDALARRLLNEVHALAWAYGWREADILGLSDERRRFYLERVS